MSKKAITTPLGYLKLEVKQSVMQQQIADMYMRSMQQFSESLEKMKLPMDLTKQKAKGHSNAIQNQNHNKNIEVEPKKEAARVFYGSRALF